MIKYILFLFILGFVIPNECLKEWSENNFKENQLFLIKGKVKQNNLNNYINIYLEKNNRYKIEYLNTIIISDQNKISRFLKNTNQLYIENSDPLLNNLIFSFIEFDNLKYKIHKSKDYYYKIKNTPYGQINLSFNKGCESLRNIEIKKHKINIDDIEIIKISDINSDSLFTLVIDKEVFKYDFR